MRCLIFLMFNTSLLFAHGFAHEIIKPWVSVSGQSLDENSLSSVFEAKTSFGQAFGKILFSRGFKSEQSQIFKFQQMLQKLREAKTEQIDLALTQLQAGQESIDLIYDKSSWFNSLEIRQMFPQDEEMAMNLVRKLAPDAHETELEQAADQLRMQNLNSMGIWQHLLISVYLSGPLVLWATISQTLRVHRSSSLSWVTKGIFHTFSAWQLSLWLQHPLEDYEKVQKNYAKLENLLKNIASIMKEILSLSQMNSGLPEELRFEISKYYTAGFQVFIEEAEQLSSMAGALRLYRILMELRKPLAAQLAVLGALDFYLAVLKKLENQGEFSWVKFEPTGSKVSLRATGLWNPHLNPKTCVKNKVALGGEKDPQQVILTGPNASGKSTYMRAVMLNVYLAQTLGIAAAREIYLQPFTQVHSLMNRRDRVGTESSFQAEVRYMRELKQYHQSISSKDRVLILLDEPFRSTNPEEAEEASRVVLDYFCTYPQSVMLISTHLKNLTDLQQGSCRRVNQHMKAYWLQDGPYLDGNALEMLRDRLATVE